MRRKLRSAVVLTATAVVFVSRYRTFSRPWSWHMLYARGDAERQTAAVVESNPVFNYE